MQTIIQHVPLVYGNLIVSLPTYHSGPANYPLNMLEQTSCLTHTLVKGGASKIYFLAVVHLHTTTLCHS